MPRWTIKGFDSHRRHMSDPFFRFNRPGYLHLVSSELENSGIRVAVGDYSTTERQRCPPYQTGIMVSYPGTVASLNKHN